MKRMGSFRIGRRKNIGLDLLTQKGVTWPPRYR